MTAFKYKLSNRHGPLTVEDFRLRARRRLPDMIWAYVEYGAEDLTTLNSNREAFDRYRLKRRVLTGNEASDLTVAIGGESLSLPVLLAPTGSAGLSHWTGERGAAQAAERSGTVSIASTSASYSYEEIAEATERDHFFQLYPWSDRATGGHELTLSLIERAQRAGYKAMFVTVDVPTVGNREYELKRGMGNPPTITPARVLDGAAKPTWWPGFVRHRRLGGRNLTDTGGVRAALKSVAAQYTATWPGLTWDDLAFMRDHWTGPMYVKGILDEDDAARAVDLGASGVVVSNHGGRQLDGDVATLDALPAIAARVGNQAEVLMDGGIRRGSDVVKALCLGADAVCIGRPYLYGMATAGPNGVEKVLEIMRTEISRVMTLMGVARLQDLNSSLILPAGAPVPSKNLGAAEPFHHSCL